MLVIGATGSGKTNSVADLAADRESCTSLILDIKGDFTAMLAYLTIERFMLVAPWDRRGWRWDIARDVTSLSQARLFASAFRRPDEPIWSTGAADFRR